MSELKEYEVRIGRKLYQTLPPIVYVVADDNQPKLLNDKVYLKSEADKVIAHNKYKRCLAMAKWCDTKGDWYYSLGENFRDCVEFYIKWRDRWLKIAEQFKGAK